MAKITRNPDRERQLLDRIKANFDKPREGVHLSDLLTPKQAYWRKIKPLPMTDGDVQFFIIGRGHEEAFRWASGFERVQAKEWNGIYYSMDFFEGVPVEMKTRRRGLAKEGEETKVYDYYLAQLKGYCACENITNGELVVWSLLEKQDNWRTAPEMVCYDVEFTEQELKNERVRLLSTCLNLEHALKVTNCHVLPDCPEWMCYKKETKQIKKPYCLTCKKEFSEEYRINKHIKSKTGRGHTIKHGEYEKLIHPKCRWYQDCKGTRTT